MTRDYPRSPPHTGLPPDGMEIAPTGPSPFPDPEDVPELPDSIGPKPSDYEQPSPEPSPAPSPGSNP